MSDRRRADVRRAAIGVGVSAWLLYAATTGGAMATGDAVAMFEVAKSIVDRGAMDVPATQSQTNWRGPDGRYYTPFGLAQSFYDIPFLLAGRAAAHIAPGALREGDTLPKAFVSAANTLPVAVAVAFGFLLAYRLSGAAAPSVLAAAVLAAGTLLWPYARFGFNAALATGAVAAGVFGMAAGALDRRARVLAAGAAAMGVAVLTRHEMALGAAAAVAWAMWMVRRDPRRAQLSFAALLPVCVAIATWMRLNTMRYGDPLVSGHTPAFALDGFRAFLVSPSGALLLYAPPAVAAVALVRRAAARDALAVLLLAVSAVLFVFYASLEDWRGTRSYGPRYLVPILPLIVAPLAIWIDRARSRGARWALALVAAAGLAIQIPAVLVDFSKAAIVLGQPPPSVDEDTWRWAPVAVNARAVPLAMSSTFNGLSSGEPTRLERHTGDAAAEPLILDFWWVHLIALSAIPPIVGIAAGALLVVLAGLTARATWRLAKRLDRPQTSAAT